MGCYVIGVTGIVANAIVTIGYAKFAEVKAKADEIYNTLKSLGVDVLLDDRKERPGVMFADMELIGIPHRLTIGTRALEQNVIEYKHRTNDEKQEIPVNEVTDFIRSQLA